MLERLALGGWSPEANARVVSVTVAANRAEVALLVNGDNGYWMYFQRDDEGWCETVSGNGPTGSWDDATVIEWGTGRSGSRFGGAQKPRRGFIDGATRNYGRVAGGSVSQRRICR